MRCEFCVANTTKDALTRGYDVRIASDAHSTWPGDGQTSEAISEIVNQELAKLGAVIETTESLARALRTPG